MSKTPAACSHLPMISPSRSQKTSAFVQGFDIFCLRTLFQWYQHFLWVLGLHTDTRLGCVNLMIQQKPTSAGMNVLREAFRDFTFPCAHNYLTCGGTDWFEKLQDQVPHYLRCQDRLSLSLLLVGAKRKRKWVSNIKHFQMLKLLFYLKITMLMLSLLLLLFICLLHNENTQFSPPLWIPGLTLLMNMVFVDAMSVPHASWQTDNTVVWITVC